MRSRTGLASRRVRKECSEAVGGRQGVERGRAFFMALIFLPGSFASHLPILSSFPKTIWILGILKELDQVYGNTRLPCFFLAMCFRWSGNFGSRRMGRGF